MAAAFERSLPTQAEFHEAISKRSGRWFSACLRITRDPALAEDAVQEALLHAWHKRHQFQGDARLDTWIHRTAINAALTIVRRRRPGIFEPLDDDTADSGNTPESDLANHDLSDSLSTALRHLTELEQISALEALISAPPERALPIVTKVLRGDSSAELKERALFVLSQIDLPEAQSLLVEMADTDDSRIRLEAIRMIGIGGDPEALAALGAIYVAGDADTKDAVLEAYLIADDSDAVYQIAVNTRNADELENAVKMLGAMGALDELRALRDRPDMADVLIDAYAVAGDVESLTALATDSSDPERQAQAIHGLGIAGGDGVGDVLVGIYLDTDVPEVKGAALEGLMIADLDRAVLELFNESTDPAEKRELLQTLVNMDSDAVWDVIDTTLENGE